MSTPPIASTRARSTLASTILFSSLCATAAWAHDGVHAGQTTTDHILTTALDLGSHIAVATPVTFLAWRALLRLQRGWAVPLVSLTALGCLVWGSWNLGVHVLADAPLSPGGRAIALVAMAAGLTNVIAAILARQDLFSD